MIYIVFQMPRNYGNQVVDTGYGIHQMPPGQAAINPTTVAVVEADGPDEACTIAASVTQQLGDYVAVEGHVCRLGVNAPKMDRGVLTVGSGEDEGNE